EMIDVRDLPERIRAWAAEVKDEDSNELLPLAEVERRHVLRVLESVGGNKVQAARILGINRATVYRIVNEQDPGEDVAADAVSASSRARRAQESGRLLKNSAPGLSLATVSDRTRKPMQSAQSMLLSRCPSTRKRRNADTKE